MSTEGPYVVWARTSSGAILCIVFASRVRRQVVVSHVERDDTDPRAERLDRLALAHPVPGPGQRFVHGIGGNVDVPDNERDGIHDVRIFIRAEAFERIVSAPPALAAHCC
jgi:hypothetical protein